MALSRQQFQRALARKQDIQAKSANADLIRARAAAGLQGAQAGEISTRSQQLGLPVSLTGLQQQIGGGIGAAAPAPAAPAGLNPALGLNQSPTPAQPSFAPPPQVQLSQTPRLGFGFLGRRDEQDAPNFRVGLGL